MIYAASWTIAQFQSHIGAIRICKTIEDAIIALLFQSHIGAIRITWASERNQERREFQSHIGAIRIASKSTVKLKLALNFNPTLVQLEYFFFLLKFFHWLNFNPTLVQLEFTVIMVSNFTTSVFQSHIGAIRMRFTNACVAKLENFNPTLVQLESQVRPSASVSDSHFNPTLVQLELFLCRLAQCRRNLISIPHWCN